MSAITLILAAIEALGTTSSVASTILADMGVTGEAVSVVKALADVLSNATVDTAIKNIITQVEKWCDGDASVTAADLIALCDAIKAQSAEIQALG